MNNQHIQFNRTRDFGELLQDSIKFVIANGKTFLRAIVFYVGPFFLVSSILTAVYLKDAFGLGDINIAEIMDDPSGFIQTLAASQAAINPNIVGLSSIIGIISYLVLATLATGIVVSYRNDPGEVELSTIKDKIMTYILPFFGLTVLMILLFLGIYIGGILVVALSAMIHPVVAGILGVALLCLLFYVLTTLSLTYPIRMEENIPSTATFKRAFQLIKGHWWQTFGVFIVLYILAMILSVGVMGLGFLASYVLGDMASVTGLLIVGALINSVLSGIIYATLYTAAGMQYYNLIEHKEAPSGDYRIDEIGRDEGETDHEETF